MEATLRSSLKKFSFGGRGTGKREFLGYVFTKLSEDDAMEMVSFSREETEPQLVESERVETDAVDCKTGQE